MGTQISELSLYLPSRTLDVAAALPGARKRGFWPWSARSYLWEAPIGTVTLNVMPLAQVEEHLEGFLGYVASLPAQAEARTRALEAIQGVEMVLGVVLPGPIATDDDTWRPLLDLAFQNGGLVFAMDSVLTADGPLVGPAAPVTTGESAHSHPEVGGRRQRSMEALRALRFSPAPALAPLPSLTLRPEGEALARACAVKAVASWVMLPEKAAPSDQIVDWIRGQKLDRFVTEEERAILAMPRHDAAEVHSDTIGWALEALWPVAWALGFDPAPTVNSGQISAGRIRELLEFLPEVGVSQSADFPLRSVDEVADLQDLFYLAHNAVRSAQLGEDTVPRGFDPIADGGTVHERRHGLTWLLSPGVAWEDTDLST